MQRKQESVDLRNGQDVFDALLPFVAVGLDVFQEAVLGQASLPVLVLDTDGDDILARTGSLAERYVDRLVLRIDRRVS